MGTTAAFAGAGATSSTPPAAVVLLITFSSLLIQSSSSSSAESQASQPSSITPSSADDQHPLPYVKNTIMIPLVFHDNLPPQGHASSSSSSWPGSTSTATGSTDDGQLHIKKLGNSIKIDTRRRKIKGSVRRRQLPAVKINSRSNGIRVDAGDDGRLDPRLFAAMLPKAKGNLVPPSGSSSCHNDYPADSSSYFCIDHHEEYLDFSPSSNGRGKP
ncbi:hypothetical protein Dimus_014509 [Dionaea muscipula]